jgi:hypothetical protein
MVAKKWLEEFLRLYPEALRRFTDVAVNAQQLEDDLAAARATMQVSKKELEAIENAAQWAYLVWYPPVSERIDEPIQLPRDVASTQQKKNAVEILHDRLKHIEVVSVILRFLCPHEFGILSPPVVSLLNLAPAEGEEHVEHYLRYISTLNELRKHYKVLQRLADIDMALWTAAHLSRDPHFEELNESMFADMFFQEVRLRNALRGLGRRWGKTNQERLVLSQVLLRHDSRLAALIAGVCYEDALRGICEQHAYAGIRPLRGAPDSLDYFVNKLKTKPDALHSVGVSCRDLDRWKKCRNDAIHQKPESPITRPRAEDLVRGVMRFL